MRPVSLAIAATAALIAAVGGGFIAGRSQHQPAEGADRAVLAPAAAQMNSATIYYKDPDGRPFYSLTPKKAPNGGDYTVVPASADVSFDETPVTESASATTTERKIRYYRNPMGLPDTSPTPKKDSMGMDYIPVYEGEDSDDGSVKLSPGKIQRTGVSSEPATSRVIRTLIRAPGTIQLDERRISVISMRAESWVQKVANITTGSKVSKGQALMEI